MDKFICKNRKSWIEAPYVDKAKKMVENANIFLYFTQ
jgi:hypothetical protein